MIYEQRIYTCLPGRLPALHKRFESATLAIWKRHGFRPSGFFTTLVGEDSNDLTYLLAWENLAERERCWAAFLADPEWHKAKADSEKDGAIVARIRNQILAPTGYSTVK